MKIYTSQIDGIKKIDKFFDFSNLIDKNNDILEIGECHVTGSIIPGYEELDLNIDINVDLVLASSRSLKPVNHHLSFNLVLNFGNGKEADFVLSNEIDLEEIVFAHILLEKPLTIFLPDEKPNDEEEKKGINPAFKELKDWKI